MPDETQSSTGAPGSPILILKDAEKALSPIERLKLARGILEKTCDGVGAGYLLIMFLPGTDLMLRSFKGLDTPEECVAAAAEVAGMLKPHVDRLTGKTPTPIGNEG